MAKVLYIGFGISSAMPGGAIIYQESLAEEMRRRGWEVVWFTGSPSGYNLKSTPYLKTRYEKGVKIVELYNSPNETGHYTNPDTQCQHPGVDRLTQAVLDREKPDIVHIHELQMHSASMIDVIRRNRIPVVKTIHNYFDICPQRDLMFRGEYPCFDFSDGRKCVECLACLPVRQKVPFLHRLVWNILPHRLYEHLSSLHKKFMRPEDRQGTLPQRVRIPYLAGQYARRRRFFVGKLNLLDRIHCSSSRSAEILTGCGVSKEKIRVIPLSVKNIEGIIPKPPRDDHYPVVFGYAGALYPSRGYQVLIDAFAKLDHKKAKLVLWLPAGLRLPDEGLNIEIRPRYDEARINEAFKDIDVGVIPSVWEEVFGIIGIEWLSARIPVIGSNIGGIPEWMRDGKDGFLVPAGDVDALVKKMELFVKDPGLIRQLQNNIRPQKKMGEHAAEMIAMYEDMRAKKKAG